MITVERHAEPVPWMRGCNGCSDDQGAITVVRFGDPRASVVARFCDSCASELIVHLNRTRT